MKSPLIFLALYGCAAAVPMSADMAEAPQTASVEMEEELANMGYLDAEKSAAPAGGAFGYASGGEGDMSGSFDEMADMPAEAPPPSPKRGRAKNEEGSRASGKKDGVKGRGEAGNGADEPAQTRAWFPETFLFAPLVVTDAAGTASHSVTVPDRLTNWRVLGLAHGADGAMAGDVVTFQGTLPVYVDPILPPFLRAGDELLMPIQAVNTTAEAKSARLTVRAEGSGRLGSAPGSVAMGAGSSAVVWAPLLAERAGNLTVYTGLGSDDAVQRVVPVVPTGRPLTDTRAGSLAAPRTFTIVSPFDADPDSARSRLSVYPGALAVLRSELDNAGRRGGLADDAYTLLLSGQAEGLLENLGGESDPEALRELSLVATQRAIRHARSPDVTAATLLARAALSHPDNPVLQRMGQRLIDQLIAQQRPDGTFQGGTGWPLQRLMIATADAVRAANAAAALDDDASRGQRVALMQLKASGAFERFAGQVEDPFTAASVLASGAAPAEQVDTLRARIRESIETAEDGSRFLPVPADVVRADGSAPTVAEATALAALALADDPEAAAWLPDLGATLMAGYSPGTGWGDGRSSLTCLEAVLAIFSTPLPDEVQITLKRDGQVIDEGVFDSAAMKDVLILESALADVGGPSTWSVEASPAVPGLGFALSVQTWVPWEEPPENAGLELQVDLPEEMRVGQPIPVTLSAAAPSGSDFVITQHLPAGVQADEESLQALVDGRVIRRYAAEDGKITLTVGSLPPGEAFSATYAVIPTLSGMLHSGPTSIAPSKRKDLAVNLPPVAWTVL